MIRSPVQAPDQCKPREAFSEAFLVLPIVAYAIAAAVNEPTSPLRIQVVNHFRKAGPPSRANRVVLRHAQPGRYQGLYSMPFAAACQGIQCRHEFCGGDHGHRFATRFMKPDQCLHELIHEVGAQM